MNLLKHFTYPAAAALLQDSGRICADTIRHFRVYIWLNEQNRQQELEATTYKIKSLRKDVHEVYMKVVDLSMIGETDGSYIKYVHFFGGYMEEISYLCYVNNNTESNGDKL